MFPHGPGGNFPPHGGPPPPRGHPLGVPPPDEQFIGHEHHDFDPLGPRIGHQDLNPQYPGSAPPFGGGFPAGNLVGPENEFFRQPHPGFQPGGPQPGFRGPGLGVPPGARYDPLGPVLGPNQDPFLGGPRGPPGRGGPGHYHFGPGEPNPDHFKPPGW